MCRGRGGVSCLEDPGDWRYIHWWPAGVSKEDHCAQIIFLLRGQPTTEGPKYMHKLWDPYYATMANSALQTSLDDESFTKVFGCLVTLFGGTLNQANLLLPQQVLIPICAKYKKNWK